jgi:hypothetical protein
VFPFRLGWDFLWLELYLPRRLRTILWAPKVLRIAATHWRQYGD